MTTLTPSSHEELHKKNTGCSEKIFRLSIAWFYVIGALSLLALEMTIFSKQSFLPFSIITNQIIILISSESLPIQVFSINIVPIIGGFLSFLFSIQYFCFGYFGYKKNLAAVITGTIFYLLDSVIHFLLGSPGPAIMNFPALLGLIIGLIILVSQKMTTTPKEVIGSEKTENEADKRIWVFIKITGFLFLCTVCYFFLTFL